MDESYAAFQALNDLASRIGFHGVVRGLSLEYTWRVVGLSELESKGRNRA